MYIYFCACVSGFVKVSQALYIFFLCTLTALKLSYASSTLFEFGKTTYSDSERVCMCMRVCVVSLIYLNFPVVVPVTCEDMKFQFLVQSMQVMYANRRHENQLHISFVVINSMAIYFPLWICFKISINFESRYAQIIKITYYNFQTNFYFNQFTTIFWNILYNLFPSMICVP